MTGKELKKIREKMGFTQKQLAKELGVSKVTISGWERGRHVMSQRYERHINLLDIDSRQAENYFTLLLDRVGPLTARDYIASVLSLTDEEIKKYAKEGMVKIDK